MSHLETNNGKVGVNIAVVTQSTSTVPLAFDSILFRITCLLSLSTLLLMQSLIINNTFVCDRFFVNELLEAEFVGVCDYDVFNFLVHIPAPLARNSNQLHRQTYSSFCFRRVTVVPHVMLQRAKPVTFLVKKSKMLFSSFLWQQIEIS